MQPLPIACNIQGGRLPSIHASAVHKTCTGSPGRRSPEPSEQQQCLAKRPRTAIESSRQAATTAAAVPPAAPAAAMEWDAELIASSSTGEGPSCPPACRSVHAAAAALNAASLLLHGCTGASGSSQKHRQPAPAQCLPQLLPDGAGGGGTEHCGGSDSSCCSWVPVAGAAAEQPDGVDAAAAASTSAAAAAAADEPCISPDGSGVRTGEGVEAFYGKYGQDSTIKFFCCIRCAR